MKKILLTISGLSLLFSACTPTVRIATPEPVKIDINARVDVVSKEDQSAKAKTNQPTEVDLARQRYERLGEIQGLKNAHVIGESNIGYLHIVNMPSDAKYADFAKKVVDEENNDRRLLYAINAQKQGEPLSRIERENASEFSHNAYPGEWIQDVGGNWKQK